MALIYLAELTVYDLSLGAERTLRYSTGLGYRTTPAETPADTIFQPRIQQPSLIRRDAFDGGTTFGASRMGYGEMVLANADGALDAFASYSFDQRAIVIRLGEDSAAYPGGFTTVFVGRMEVPEVGRKSVSIKIRDRQKDLDKSIMPARFLGIVSGTGGIEGDASLKGSVPPISLGGVIENATPVEVNTSDKIFAVNFGGALSRSTLSIGTGDKAVALDRTLPLNVGNYARIAVDAGHYMIGTLGTVAGTLATIVVGTIGGTGTFAGWQFLSTLPVHDFSAVRDRGVALSYTGTDRANLAALRTGTGGTAGQYDVCTAEGLFKTIGTTFFAVTGDWTEGTAANARNAAQIGQRIMLRAPGIGTADLSSADIGTLGTANGAALTLYINQDETFRQALDDVMNSVGAFWGPDRLGTFRMQQIALPTGTASISLVEAQILDFKWRPSNDPGRGVPAFRINVNERKNWTVQDPAALALTAADAYAGFASSEWRTAVWQDVSVLDAYKSEVELTFDTLFAGTGTSGTAEAARRGALYGTFRPMADARVYVGTALAAILDIGAEMKLTIIRFGLGSGAYFRVLGFQPDLRRGVVDMTLLGTG